MSNSEATKPNKKNKTKNTQTTQTSKHSTKDYYRVHPHTQRPLLGDMSRKGASAIQDTLERWKFCV